jgi:AcrR family transcriptional regulator
MVEVAVELFIEQGYDDTTMEQIAERAEVGTSTLYRYFPSKDLLLLDRLVQSMEVGIWLRERPDDEPLDEALGRALTAIMERFDDPELRITRIRRVVDEAPVPRARLWDYMLNSRADLEQAIGERMDLAATDLSVRATAGMVFEVIQLVDDERKRHGDGVDSSRLLAEILDGLAQVEVVRPATPARSRRH